MISLAKKVLFEIGCDCRKEVVLARARWRGSDSLAWLRDAGVELIEFLSSR